MCHHMSIILQQSLQNKGREYQAVYKKKRKNEFDSWKVSANVSYFKLPHLLIKLL